MENSEDTKNVIVDRAKVIDTGAIPLPMSNVLLGLPYKPDSTVSQHCGIMTRPWTYGDLVSQEKLLADVPVTLTSSGVIWEFLNSWENVLDTHFHTTSPNSTLRSLFGVKSWTTNFRFEFRSNFQQVGQICVFYSNLPKILENYHFGLEESKPMSNYTVMTQLPHRKIPMGEDQDLQISLKWTSPHSGSFGYDMYNSEGNHNASRKNPMYDMGTLYMAVPFPMQVATGVNSTMTVRIWTWLSDFCYGAYNPQDSIL